MGREQRNLIGIGYNQQEAENNAFSKDEEYHGHGEGYGGGRGSLDEILKVTQLQAPKSPGKATVEREPSTVKPKWARRWVVKNHWPHRGEEGVYNTFEKQTEAVAFAKAETLRVHVELSVAPEYILIEGRPTRIIVKHTNGLPGQWRFECLFRS